MSAEVPKRITVIDDDPAIVSLLGTLLESQGYRFRGFDSSFVGLKNLKQERPDMVVLDLVMPNIDGLEVIQSLRKHEAMKKLPQLPVLMLSAYYEDLGRLARNIRPSNVSYLRKPFQIEDFFGLIGNGLSNRPNPTSISLASYR